MLLATHWLHGFFHMLLCNTGHCQFISVAFKRGKMSEIIEGPKCSLLEIINPGEYLLLSQDEEHISEMKHLEESLTKEMKFFQEQNEISLIPEMDVIVELKEKGEYLKRGRLKSKVFENTYQVYLIDYGELVTVEKSSIFVVGNDLFNAIEPLTFTLKLHGLLPVIPCSVNDILKQQVSKDWSSESRVFVEGLFKAKSEIIVEIKLIYNNTVYGDIFIYQGNFCSEKSLRKMLMKHEYCVYSEVYFLRTVFGMNHVAKLKSNADSLPPKEKKMSAPKVEDSNKNERVAPEDLVTKKKHGFDTRWLISSLSNGKKTDVREVSIGRGKILCLPWSHAAGKDTTVGLETPRIHSSKKPWPSREPKKSTKELEMNSQDVNNSQTFTPYTSSFTGPSLKCSSVRAKFKERTAEDQEEDVDIFLSTKNPLLRVERQSSFPEEPGVPSENGDSGVAKAFKRNIDSIDSWNIVNEYGEPFVLFKDCQPVEPVATFKDLTIGAGLKRRLNELDHFEDLNSVQRWSVPSILRGENVVAIGSPNTGKTLSCILPVLDFVDRMLMSELPPGNGPLAVILCSSSRVCDSIRRTCDYLLNRPVECQGRIPKTSVVVAYGQVNLDKLWVKLTNGCHILISTPPCLIRLLEMPVITNLERLSCLVLDEFDVLAQEPFRWSVSLILERGRSVAKNQNFQKIFSATRWTPQVESLLCQHVSSYVLIMSSYLEAAIFARLKPKIYLSDKTHKSEIMHDEIRKGMGKRKILVACESARESLSVKNYLRGKSVECVVAHEYVEADRFRDILLEWTIWRPLVATDAVFTELKIKDADVLIHYTMTRKSKTNFFFRYSSILDGCFERGSKTLRPNEEETPVDLILLDEENDHQLPQIVDYATRLGGNVAHRLNEISQDIRHRMETSKESGICQKLLSAGYCRDYSNCPQRHAFLHSLDSPSRTHPSQGWVSFSVVKVHDASRFSVRLLQHLNFDGTKSHFDDNNVVGKVNHFYEAQANRRVLTGGKVGDVCGVKSKRCYSESFHRGEVTECLARDSHGQGTEFIVRLMDGGDFMHVKRAEMYELPPDLASIPPLTVDVILVGIRPMDYDMYWSKDATAFTADLLLRELEEEQNWFGRIVLALKNVVFLESVMLKRHLAGVKANVFDLVLEEEILKAQFGVANKHHLENLVRLCEEGGLELPPGKGRGRESWPMEPPWPTFNEKEVLPVTISVVEDVSTIFVRRKDSEDLVANLEEGCRAEAEKAGLSNDDFHKFSPGMFCLVPFIDSWRRGRIESETESAFEINLVDYGMMLFVGKDRVKPLRNIELLRVPCQAVECRLVGVEAKERMEPEVLGEMCAFLFEEPWISAEVCGEEAKGKKASGPKYSLNLLNSKGESLSELLLRKGMVTAVEKEASQMEVNLTLGRSRALPSAQPQRTDDRKAAADCDLVNYLTRLPDDLFGNVNEVLFLEEFAGRVFGKESRCMKETDSKGSVAEEPGKSSSLENVANIRGKYSKKRRELPRLKIRNEVLTPQVFWRQDQRHIRLKIVLSNVEKYRCYCTGANILFRCVVDGKLYAVDVKLFGGVEASAVVIRTKAFAVMIGLSKVCSSMWPRLHRDEGKHWWIHLDLDGLIEEGEDSVLSAIEATKRSMEAGVLREGIRGKNLLPYSDSEGDDEEDEELKFSDSE